MRWLDITNLNGQEFLINLRERVKEQRVRGCPHAVGHKELRELVTAQQQNRGGRRMFTQQPELPGGRRPHPAAASRGHPT